MNSLDSSPTFRGSRISGNTLEVRGRRHLPHGRVRVAVRRRHAGRRGRGDRRQRVRRRFSPADNPSEGGGVHIEDNATATLTRVRVLRNHANTGGGLNAYRARYDIVDSIIEGNAGQRSPPGFGGGIAATSNNVSATAPGDRREPHAHAGAQQRRATSGGGIGGDPATATTRRRGPRCIVDSVVDWQPSARSGRRHPAQQHRRSSISDSLVIRNTVTGGSVPFGGGLLVSPSTAAISPERRSRGNTAGAYGGGIFIDDGASLDDDRVAALRQRRRQSERSAAAACSSGRTGATRARSSTASSPTTRPYQIVEHQCPPDPAHLQQQHDHAAVGQHRPLRSNFSPSRPTLDHRVQQARRTPRATTPTLPRFAHFLAAPGAGTRSRWPGASARATS